MRSALYLCSHVFVAVLTDWQIEKQHEWEAEGRWQWGQCLLGQGHVPSATSQPEWGEGWQQVHPQVSFRRLYLHKRASSTHQLLHFHALKLRTKSPNRRIRDCTWYWFVVVFREKSTCTIKYSSRMWRRNTCTTQSPSRSWKVRVPTESLLSFTLWVLLLWLTVA